MNCNTFGLPWKFDIFILLGRTQMITYSGSFRDIKQGSIRDPLGQLWVLGTFTIVGMTNFGKQRDGESCFI